MIQSDNTVATQHPYPAIEAVKAALRKTGVLICQAVGRVAQCVFDVLTFPCRYFGSKTWYLGFANGRISICKTTGYHTKLKKISQDKLRDAARYAAATLTAHSNRLNYAKTFGFSIVAPQELAIDTSKLSTSLQVRDNCFFDIMSGLKATLLQNEKTGEVILTFGAFTASDQETKSWCHRNFLRSYQGLSMASTVIGQKASLFDEALSLYQEIAKAMPNGKIRLAGHCQGGALAQYVGILSKTKTMCFNSFPLGAGLQYRIGYQKLSQADKYVSHVSSEGDWTSDNKMGLSVIDTICCAVGIKSPGNFGNRYLVPSAYSESGENHRYIFGSMVQAMGYNRRTVPSEMRPEDIFVEPPKDSILPT